MEALCKELYESQDAAARAEAEKALVSFQVKHLAFFSPFLLPFSPPEQSGEPGKVPASVGPGQLSLCSAPCHNYHHQADQPVLKDSMFMFVCTSSSN